MAEEGQQQQQQQPGSPPEGGGGNQPPTQRPDFIPEQFWDPAKGEAKLEALGKGYTELRTAFNKGKETYKAEYEAERVKGRPADVGGYKLDSTKLPAGIVLLEQPPAADFKPEAGKTYLQLDGKSPLLEFWRQHCFDNAIGQDGFMAGLATFAKVRLAGIPTKEQLETEKATELAKLGENGQQRAEHVANRLTALLGEAGFKAIDDLLSDAAAIEAFETLLEKTGEPRFGEKSAAAKTAENAAAKIAQLKADKTFQEKFLDKSHPEHKQAYEQMLELQRQVDAGTQKAA